MKFLGKLPKKTDRLRRTLQISKYLDVAKLPPIPANHVWSSKVVKPIGMMGNDTVGDCTFAALGHGEQVWTANHGKQWTPPDSLILSAYSSLTGYDPNQPQTDQGANLLDVLNYARQIGIGGHRIGVFAEVDHHNLAMVKACMFLFGGVICGFQLPKLAETQFDAGRPWALPWYGPRGDAKPGSLGGHAVLVPDFTKQGATGATWNEWQNLTWAWWKAYCDECYVTLADDWADGKSPAPSGLDRSALLADLKLVTA